MIGDVESIDNASVALKKNLLVLKFVEGLKDYLSCEVRFSVDKKKAWLGQHSH